MRKSLKKALSALLAVILLLSAVPIMASAVDTLASTGKCGDNVTWSFNSSTGTLTISGTGDMYDYRDRQSPFYQKDSIKSVIIKSAVTTIGSYSFSCCYKLASITISDSINSIHNNAFAFCNYLKSANISKNVETIGNEAFYYCENLNELTLNEGLTTIGNSAFGNCEKLSSVVIPNSVKSIGDNAFSDCSIKNIFLSENIKHIGDNAFINCDNLEAISVSEKNTVYDSRNDCNALIETKTNSLIQGCKTTTIPKGITTIGIAAFMGCDIKNIILPEGIKTIEEDAFAFTYIESITIPNGVVSIGSSAFKFTNLTNITIPTSLTSIGAYAFSGCSTLTDVYYKGTKEQWENIEICAVEDELLNANIHFEGEHTHTYKHIVIPADCVTSGMEYDICPDCGDVINSKVLSATGHSWGEWKTTIEPTGTKEGKAERKCTKCSATETKAIEKLNIVKDEKTGIEIEYKDQFDKNLEIKVEEKFDGKSYQLLDMECENSKYHIFDITTYENGKKVQPDGKVTVRIPLPDGFGTKNLLVCHVDAENNKVTYIPAKVVGNFVELSAEHFSDYAVVELSGIVEKVNVNDVELKYKKTAKITPEVTLDGDVKYTVKYESSNPSVATVDKNGNITTFGKGETKITCTVTDAYGNEVKDTCTVTVKFSFGQWLIWILLFGFLWY